MAEQCEVGLEVVYVVEGERAPRAAKVDGQTRLADLIQALTQEVGRQELSRLYREDEEAALALELTVLELLAGEFKVFHLGRPEPVKVDVAYNGRVAQADFAPSATVRKVIAWAISPESLNLQGDSSDFQLKHDGELLPPDLHVGQLRRNPHEAVRLTLVFKIKPQG